MGVPANVLVFGVADRFVEQQTLVGNILVRIDHRAQCGIFLHETIERVAAGIWHRPGHNTIASLTYSRGAAFIG